MLIFTRKVGEQIQIGDQVVVTVIRCAGQNVRIGVQAPADTPVVRGEIGVRTADPQPKAAR